MKSCEIITANRFLLLLLVKPGLAGLTDFKQFYKLCWVCVSLLHHLLKKEDANTSICVSNLPFDIADEF